MIEQVEEVRPETQVLPFAQLEGFTESEVYVFLRGADDAIARRVAVNRRITAGAAREGRKRVGHISQRIPPVGQPRLWSSLTGSIRAPEAGSKCSGRGWSAGQGVRGASRWIIDREWRSRLQGHYAAGFPSPQRSLGKTTGAGKERQLIDGAGDEALATIEVGEAAGGCRVGLIVDASQECHRSSRHVVNRFGPGIGALQLQALAEVVGQRRLQGTVVGIGVRCEIFEISRRNAKIRCARRGVFYGRIHDRARQTLGLEIGATWSRNGDRILRRSQRGLIGIVSRAQASTLGSDVAQFPEPVPPEFALSREVPLLCGTGDPMQGHSKLNQAIHVTAEIRTTLCTRTSGTVAQRTGGIHALENRRSGHVFLSGIGAEWRNAVRKCGAVREQVRKAVRSGIETHEKRIGWRNNGEIIHRAQVFADAVNAITAANRGGMVASDVISETNAPLPDRRVFIVEPGLIERSGDTGKTEFIDALRIDVGLPGRVCEVGISIAGMAKRVIGCAQKLVAYTEIERESLADAVIILSKPGVAGNAVIVVAQATPAFAEERGTRHKTLEVRTESGR